mmetsp:Transcript_3190/g.5010  ORF Transcript_3190/g.5010 Transcript_3190/m.5010 type:complete len:279 (+) Transcript_3190:86-922(+)
MTQVDHHLRQGAATTSEVDIAALHLVVKVVRHSSKHNSCRSEKTSENCGRRNGRGSFLHLSRGLQSIDEVARVRVGVVDRSACQSGLALACILVETLANFQDLVSVVVIAVVVLVRISGFLARNTIIVDEVFGRVGQSLSVAELLISAAGSLEGASFVHEGAEIDILSVCRAVGTNEELHLLVLVVVVAIVVLLLVVVIAILLVVVVLEGLVVDIEFTAFDGVFELELGLILTVVVVVVVVVVVTAVVETCVDVTLVLIIIVAVLPNHLTVVLLRIQL